MVLIPLLFDIQNMAAKLRLNMHDYLIQAVFHNCMFKGIYFSNCSYKFQQLKMNHSSAGSPFLIHVRLNSHSKAY